MFEHLKYVRTMDDAVFREVMLLYGQDVWNYAFFLTNRRDWADDIAQDVFFSMYRNIESYKGQSPLKTWLFAITRNTAHNYRRNAFFRKVILMDWIESDKRSPSAEHEALDSLLSNEMWRIVMRLPVKFREVLILDAKYEMTAKEISDLLGISAGTVKSRLSRARKKAEQLWKEPVHEPI